MTLIVVNVLFHSLFKSRYKGLVVMPELNSKVTKTLNKTTPGLQIWRIEVRMNVNMHKSAQ